MQIGEKRIAQIELALDTPPAFVFQFVGAIEGVDEVPFRFNQGEFELVAKLGKLPVMVIAILTIVDVSEPSTQMSADRPNHPSDSACQRPIIIAS